MGFMDKFKDAAAQAGQMAHEATKGAGPQAEMRDRAVKLNNSGVNQPATITAMRETGATDPGGGKEVEFTVDVRPDGGAPYTTTFNQFMIASVMEQLSEGAEITVRVDPDDPNVAVLWARA